MGEASLHTLVEYPQSPKESKLEQFNSPKQIKTK